MTKLILMMTLLCSQVASASLTSPFPSTVEGIDIPNTHALSDNIIRGMAPLGKMGQLVDYGITDILIFKNQTRSEIDQEYSELKEVLADTSIDTYQYDFYWHDYPSYKVACEQTIDALRVMRAVNEDNNRKLFYHCTVGEDRTGFLSGLWRMLSQNWSKKKAFYKEMCENGYANGNPNKPDYVVGEIREDLTPLFLYMSDKIESGKLKLSNLTKSICKDEIPLNIKIMYCRSSSKI